MEKKIFGDRYAVIFDEFKDNNIYLVRDKFSKKILMLKRAQAENFYELRKIAFSQNAFDFGGEEDGDFYIVYLYKEYKKEIRKIIPIPQFNTKRVLIALYILILAFSIILIRNYPYANWLPENKTYIGIFTNPARAEIYIDGKDTGFATPKKFYNLAYGIHRIKIDKDGFVPYVDNVEILRGFPDEINATLKPKGE